MTDDLEAGIRRDDPRLTAWLHTPAYGHQWSAYGPRTERLSWWRRFLAWLEVG